MVIDNQSQLQDIVAAPAAHWWPLAPGWYLVGISATVLLVVLVWQSWRAYVRRQARRLALRQLDQLQAQPSMSVNDISLLLKQAALAYFPKAAVNSTETEHWWRFLLTQLSTSQQQRYQSLLNQLQHVAYQPQSKQAPWLEDYADFAQRWLRQAVPPSRKQIERAVSRGES